MCLRPDRLQPDQTTTVLFDTYLLEYHFLSSFLPRLSRTHLHLCSSLPSSSFPLHPVPSPSFRVCCHTPVPYNLPHYLLSRRCILYQILMTFMRQHLSNHKWRIMRDRPNRGYTLAFRPPSSPIVPAPVSLPDLGIHLFSCSITLILADMENGPRSDHDGLLLLLPLPPSKTTTKTAKGTNASCVLSHRLPSQRVYHVAIPYAVCRACGLSSREENIALTPTAMCFWSAHRRRYTYSRDHIS